MLQLRIMLDDNYETMGATMTYTYDFCAMMREYCDYQGYKMYEVENFALARLYWNAWAKYTVYGTPF